MAEERTVNLVDVSKEDAKSLHEKEMSGSSVTVEAIAKAVPDFTDVDCFTTFKARYAWVGEDLVIHFFVTEELKELNEVEGPAVKAYWMQSFPLCLDNSSKRYFQADSPRLQAKYTVEMASWYFRAQGYVDRLDLDQFAVSFLEELDRDLERQSALPLSNQN